MVGNASEIYATIDGISVNGPINERLKSLEKLRSLLVPPVAISESQVHDCITRLSAEVSSLNNAAIYAFTTTTKLKQIAQFFPSTVESLTLVWAALTTKLDNSNSHDANVAWQSTTILWTWMGSLSKIPFSWSKMQGDDWFQHLVAAAVERFGDAGPSRDAAATALALWMGRDDGEWNKELIRAQVALGGHRRLACLRLVATLTKLNSWGKDKLNLLVIDSSVWHDVSALVDDRSFTVKRLVLKILSRCVYSVLPKKIRSWRYHHRRLARVGKDNNIDMSTEDKSMIDDQLFEIPDFVEDVMEHALDALGDSSTEVRQSAAKAVGRMAERLPNICGDDVLDFLLEAVFATNSDSDWHGGCLSIAEMGRRGMLQNRLGEIVPILVEALQFDAQKGASTWVGVNVRDAACYAYWAICRSYPPSVLRPYLNQMNESIVLVALFDREVNCRRAASAAFQEATGRQGASSCPNGLSIIMAADYYSLANRENSYHKVALEIAHFKEYTIPIIQHLSSVRLSHWDATVRAQAARSLHLITQLDAQHMATFVLPELLSKCVTTKSPAERHGVVMGCADIILALHDQPIMLSEETRMLLISLPSTVEKNRLYRGRWSELIRYAMCRYVECTCRSRLELSVAQQVQFLDCVDACIQHPSESVQTQACIALSYLLEYYFPVHSKGPSPRLQARVVDKFLKIASTETNPAATRGYCLALGHVPVKLVATNNHIFSSVANCLIESAASDSLVGGSGDAATRRNAISSIGRLLCRVSEVVGQPAYPVVRSTEEVRRRLLRSLLCAIDDYETDRRGDVGSWCRIEAMRVLTDGLMASHPRVANNFMNEGDSFCIKVVAGMLKQMSEKLDTVRKVSAECLQLLLRHKTLPIPYKQEMLEKVFFLENGTYVLKPAFFPVLMEVAALNSIYFTNIIRGTVLSLAGLSESLAKVSQRALLVFTRDSDADWSRKLFTLLSTTIRLRDRALTVPSLKTIKLLLDHGMLKTSSLPRTWMDETVELLNGLSVQTKSFSCLSLIIDVNSSLVPYCVQNRATQHSIMMFLCRSLGHEFPKLRVQAAEQLYLHLSENSMSSGINPDDLLLLIKNPWATLEGADLSKKVASFGAKIRNV